MVLTTAQLSISLHCLCAVVVSLSVSLSLSLSQHTHTKHQHSYSHNNGLERKMGCPREPRTELTPHVFVVRLRYRSEPSDRRPPPGARLRHDGGQSKAPPRRAVSANVRTSCKKKKSHQMLFRLIRLGQSGIHMPAPRTDLHAWRVVSNREGEAAVES